MTTYMHLRRRVAASTLVGLVAVAACGSDDGATTGATEAAPVTEAPAATEAAPATETPPVTEAAPATEAAPVTEAASGVAWSMDAVGPGTFTTAVMEPGFTLTYGEGWVPFMPESRNQLNIEIPESSDLGCAPCGLFGVSAAEADTADDVVEFAMTNGLEISDPEEIDVGGVPGRRYEVVGGEGYIFETEFAEFGVDSAEGPARFTVLEAGGRVIVIHELAMPDVVDTIWPWSDDIIASIEWSVG